MKLTERFQIEQESGSVPNIRDLGPEPLHAKKCKLCGEKAFYGYVPGLGVFCYACNPEVIKRAHEVAEHADDL